MGLRHITGLIGLDGKPVPVQSGPPPPPPKATPILRPDPRELAAQALYQAEALYSDTKNVSIEITDREKGLTIQANGDTMDEAIQDAVAQYENAQPVKPLVFLGGDGAVSTLDPMTRSILTEALILFEASASGQGAPASTMTMLARVKASVGDGQ